MMTQLPLYSTENIHTWVYAYKCFDTQTKWVSVSDIHGQIGVGVFPHNHYSKTTTANQRVILLYIHRHRPTHSLGSCIGMRD